MRWLKLPSTRDATTETPPNWAGSLLFPEGAATLTDSGFIIVIDLAGLPERC